MIAPLQVALSTDGEDAKRADLPAIRQSFEAKILALKTIAETLTVTDATQVSLMKQARTARLEIREARLEFENWWKDAKAWINERAKAMDGFKRSMLALFDPLEARLLDQETFAERAEKARQDALARERHAKLAEYETDSTGMNLGTMPEAAWTALLKGSKDTWGAKAGAQFKAEQDRLAAVKAAEEERTRIKAENERLKAEAETQRRERLTAETQAREEREAEARIQKRKTEAAEAIAKIERDEREKLEKELAAKKKAEADAEKATFAAARKAASAPDKAKLEALADAVGAIVWPAMATPEGRRALAEISGGFTTLGLLIRGKAESL